jgi:hypothetical protein
MSTIDDILGRNSGATAKDADIVQTELLADVEEPETYRPYLVRSRPQVMFSLIESDGTSHGFQYHALRHPKHQVRNGEEFLSFTADGLAVVMQGERLRILYLALLRYTLAEAREYDRKPMGELLTKITRLEVEDVQERVKAAPRLVK